jgi:cytoskeletal protein RodZ
MVQFGDELRLEREQRGVSLEAMCASTKLSLRQILDVEAGNFRELPGGVFRKGFVRSYVRALDLDEPLWLERFEASYRASGLANSEADWASFAENVKNNRIGSRRPSNRLKWVGVLGMALILALLTIGIWKYVLVPRLDTQRRSESSMLTATPAVAPQQVISGD